LLIAVGIGLALIALAPLIVAAQTGTPIQYGETVSGEISEEVACQYYWFEGAAGDSISADMTRTSGSLDGILSLYLHEDFTADPVAFNDDRSGGGLDPLITATLPATDWYTLAACRLDNENMRVTVGTFDLTLSASEGEAAGNAAVEEEPGDSGAAIPTAGPSITGDIFPSEGEGQPTAAPTSSGESITSGIFPSESGAEFTATPTPAASGDGGSGGTVPSGELIEPGSVIIGQLVSNVPQVDYRLEVKAGDLVSIYWQQTSGDLAPQIMIINAKGDEIAMASTVSIASTLQLVFVAPASGMIGIAVQRCGMEVNETAAEYEFIVRIYSE
jgi:hypothetical protein